MKRTSIRKVSRYQAARLAKYRKLKAQFLESNPMCQYRYESGFLCNDCFGVTIHHIEGRRGNNLLDAGTFMTVCPIHHDWIHSHGKEARAKGYLK